jgi:clan AA aspartic protease (TIGR02281 family)
MKLLFFKIQIVLVCLVLGASRNHLIASSNQYSNNVQKVSNAFCNLMNDNSEMISWGTKVFHLFSNLEIINAELNVNGNNITFILVRKSGESLIADKFSLNAKYAKVDILDPQEKSGRKYIRLSCQTGIKHEIYPNANNRANIYEKKYNYEEMLFLTKHSMLRTQLANILLCMIKVVSNPNTAVPNSFDKTPSGLTLKTHYIAYDPDAPKIYRISNGKTSASGNNVKTIRMTKMAGNTYQVACKVNGTSFNFIFDTGASNVTLSRQQALRMLNAGTLSYNDIIGRSSYQTANGAISVGTEINLRKVEIGGLLLTNVRATVVNSDNAPLLLGQSVLSRLGTIMVDYKTSTISIFP